MTLIEFYNDSKNKIVFEGLKREINNSGYTAKALCFKQKMFISFCLRNKRVSVVEISTDLMREIIKVEEILRSYYGNVKIFIKEHVIQIYI